MFPEPYRVVLCICRANLKPKESQGMKTSALRVALLVEFASGGGALTYAKQLLTYCASRGFDTEIFPFGPVDELIEGAVRERPGVRAEEASAAREAIARYGRNPVGYHVETRRLTKTVLSMDRPVDLVISSVCSPGRFLHVGAGAVPHVQILHSYPRGWKHALGGFAFRSYAKQTNLIGVSQTVVETMSRMWHLPMAREPAVLRNTVGPMVTNPRGFSGRTNQVLAVGAVTKQKDPLKFVRLASRVLERGVAPPGLTFVWLGDGPLLTAARDAVSELGLENAVFFPGFIPDPAPWYHNSRVFLHTSSVDSLPLSVLDAFRFGLPAVVTDAGGLPEMMGESLQSSVISRDNQEAMVQALEELLCDPGLWAQKADAVRERYQEGYSPTRWEQDLDRMIWKVQSLSN